MHKLRCDRPAIGVPCRDFPKLSEAVFSKEPSLLCNSPVAVRAQGGQLSKIALAHVEKHYAGDILRAEKEGLSSSIDVRVQRLMPGMYPSIPGWHCDAVPRGTSSGQPNFDAIHQRAFHVALLLSTEPCGVSNTQFVDQDMVFKLWDVEGKTRYSQLHAEVEKHKPQVLHVRDGEFVRYSQRTVHRAMPTGRRGWRMYFRYSMIPNAEVRNLMPEQQQVYILSEEAGW